MYHLLSYLSVPIPISRLLSHPINCVEIIIGPYTRDWLLQEVHDPVWRAYSATIVRLVPCSEQETDIGTSDTLNVFDTFFPSSNRYALKLSDD
jgi:hypothetical protein